MGGTPNQQTTQQQQQTGQTISQPWGPAQGALMEQLRQIQGQQGNTGMTAQESAAFQQMLSQYGAGNPYAGAIGQSAQDMLGGGPDRTGGVTDAYNQYAQQVMPWANGAMGDPSSNPALAAMLKTIQGDTSNSVNSQFAASGRDSSGYNTQALARGLAQGEAPALLQAQQMGLGAAKDLYNAGNARSGLLSQLDTQKFANQQAGVGQAANALGANMWGPQGILSTMSAQRNLPLSNIANLNSLLLPIAGLGGQTNSSGTSSGMSNSQMQVPWWQQALGTGMAAAGTAGKFFI